jgi:hypothetical protein
MTVSTLGSDPLESFFRRNQRALPEFENGDFLAFTADVSWRWSPFSERIVRVFSRSFLEWDEHMCNIESVFRLCMGYFNNENLASLKARFIEEQTSYFCNPNDRKFVFYPIMSIGKDFVLAKRRKMPFFVEYEILCKSEKGHWGIKRPDSPHYINELSAANLKDVQKDVIGLLRGPELLITEEEVESTIESIFNKVVDSYERSWKYPFNQFAEKVEKKELDYRLAEIFLVPKAVPGSVRKITPIKGGVVTG